MNVTRVVPQAAVLLVVLLLHTSCKSSAISEDVYLEQLKKDLGYYKDLGERAMAQLDEEDLFWRPDSSSNSISILVQHISGNMTSRWTNFMIEDGEKQWRDRDTEFEWVYTSRSELLQDWEAGWTTLYRAIDAIEKENLMDVITVRGKQITLYRALQLEFGHYAYHVGQLVYLAQVTQGDQWQSLTIPLNESKKFNETFSSVLP